MVPHALFLAQGPSREPIQSQRLAFWLLSEEGWHHPVTYRDGSVFKWATNCKSVFFLATMQSHAPLHQELKEGSLLFLRSNRKRRFYLSEPLVWIENLTRTHAHTHARPIKTHTHSHPPVLKIQLWGKKPSKNKRLKGSRQKKTELLCDVFALSLPPSTSSLPKCRL